MEKNQQNQMGEDTASAGISTTDGGRPGQQLPTRDPGSMDRQQETLGKMDQHSESSLPEKDEETLGTP